MKLTMGERFVLLQILPEQGSLLTLKAARILREALAPAEKERKEYKFKEIEGKECPACGNKEGGRIEWDTAMAPKTKDIEVPPIMVEIVKKKLTEMEKAEKLPDQWVPLYEKFIPEIK